MRELLDSDRFEFRFEVGVADISSRLKLSNHGCILQSLATHFTVVRVKAQIDQIIDGLKALGVYDLIKAKPNMMRKLFVTQIEPTSDFMVNLFEIKFSPGGSNRREDEEQVVMYRIVTAPVWTNSLKCPRTEEAFIGSRAQPETQ